MSMESALKRLRKTDELLEELVISEEDKLRRRVACEEFNKFLNEWFRLLKFSDEQIEVFRRFYENSTKDAFTLKELLEIIYDLTVKTLIVMSKRR